MQDTDLHKCYHYSKRSAEEMIYHGKTGNEVELDVVLLVNLVMGL